jgi:multiple sugar transport system permease protein
MQTETTQRKYLWWGVNALVLLYAFIPVIWIISLSLKDDATLNDGNYVPVSPTGENYAAIFTNQDFLRALVNSIGICVIATFIAIVFGTMAAYAIARLNFPGKTAIVAVSLLISMFPQIALVTPLYVVLNDLRLTNTYEGLATCYVGLALPLMIYIMYGYFRGIPREMEEAAKIDGAGLLRTIWSVITPLALPGVVTAGLIGFMINWQEFMLALAYTSTPDRQTIPVGIANFTGLYFVPWGDMAAASVAVTIPLVVLVMVFQRRIIAGVTAGGVKG